MQFTTKKLSELDFGPIPQLICQTEPSETYSQVSTVQWCYTKKTLNNICSVLNELSTKCETIYCRTSSVTRQKLETILQKQLDIKVTYQ